MYASHREQFADHHERRAFLPQFSDAVAVRQQCREPLRRDASEAAHRFSKAFRLLISSGGVIYDDFLRRRSVVIF